jgi:hypothetical protein
MRGRLGFFLPIFLIAMMVQLVAPIGSCWARVLAAADPLSAAPICQGSPDSGESHHDQQAKRDGSCALCLASEAAIALPTLPGEAALARTFYRVAYSAAAPSTGPASLFSGANARAPPIQS